MKTRMKKRNAGIVLPSVLALVFCACVIVAALAVQAVRSMVLTRRSLEYQRASVLAESGLGYGIMYLRTRISEMGWQRFSNSHPADSMETLDVSSLLDDYDGEYKNGVYFKVLSNMASSSTLDDGSINIEVSAISRNLESGIASAMRETVSITFSNLGKYAAFYTRDLEAFPGEDMIFKGKVHSNGDLYLGADGSCLKFERNVTAHGKFYAQRKPNSGYDGKSGFYISSANRLKFRKGDDDLYAEDANGNSTKPTEYMDVIRNKDGRTTRMDSGNLGSSWTSESASYYEGAIKTDQQKLAPPISVDDDEHTIIERVKQPSDNGYNKDTEAVKFATKASLTMHIDSDGNLHLYDKDKTEIGNPERLMQPAAAVSKSSASGSSTGHYTVTESACSYVDEEGTPQTTGNLPAYQVSNYIYDMREQKAMALVDVYVDEILNSGTLKSYLYPDNLEEDDAAVPGVLYVTSDMTAYRVPQVTTETYGTGQYTQSTDTRTTTSETEKNSLVAKGYTIVSTIFQRKYGSNWIDTDEATYNRTSKDKRRKKYTLEKTLQTEIMETVAVTNYAEIPVQPAVRLRNASDLRSSSRDGNGNYIGLSIATDLPLYVEGSYNTNGQKGSPSDPCTDKPAALVAADAVTMLSSCWKDSSLTPNWAGWDGTRPSSVYPFSSNDKANTAFNARTATDGTTFNGVLMTGIVESNNGQYSGGLQNLFRFHEYWGGTRAYNFNGSMICMWTSNVADKPIGGSYIYQPPKRPWSWAQMNPPGLPNLMNFRETDWERISPTPDVYEDSDFFND